MDYINKENKGWEIMIDLEKIGKVISRKQSDQDEYFYDRRNQTIIKKDQKFMSLIYGGLDKSDLKNMSEEDQEFVADFIDLLVIESKKLVPIPHIDSNLEIKLMKDFCQYIKEENVAHSVEIKKSIGGKGTFARFKSKIKEFGYEKEFDKFRQTIVEDIAYDWAVENEIIENEYCLQGYETLFNTMKNVFEMELWKMFKVENLIHVKYDKKDYYFTIYGWDNSFPGIEVLIGSKGLEAHSFILDGKGFNMSPKLLVSLQDCYRLQFNEEKYLSDDDKTLLKDIDMVFENNSYPQVQKLKRGFIPNNKLCEEELVQLNQALEALMKACCTYLDNPIFIDYTQYELYINLDKRIPFISKRRLFTNCEMMINPICLEEDNIVVVDKTVEFFIDCLDSRIESEVSLHDLWGYVLIGIEETTGYIEHHIFDTYDEHNALLKMQNDIIAEFLINGFPSKIKCANYLVYDMFCSLNNYGVEVLAVDPSDTIIDIFDELDELPLNNNDEFVH